MSPVISCREAVRNLWRFLDEELESGDRDLVEGHLEHCVQCCGELEFVRMLQGLLASQQTPELPQDVRVRLDRFVDELTDARRRHSGA